METNIRVYNHWQLYSQAKALYKEGRLEGTFKIRQFDNRNNVYKFKVYIKDNDVMVSATNSDSISFMFIGTDDFKDWKDNFDAKFVEHDGVKYHRGFYDSAALFTDTIKQIVDNNPLRNIDFIGKSKGGAMSTIAAILFIENRFDKRGFTVRNTPFGSPRCADYQLTDKLTDLRISYCRVIFTRDIVCDLPPIAMGYEHPWKFMVYILPTSWWHRFRFMFVKVHLDYERTINTKIFKRLKQQRNTEYTF